MNRRNRPDGNYTRARRYGSRVYKGRLLLAVFIVPLFTLDSAFAQAVISPPVSQPVVLQPVVPVTAPATLPPPATPQPAAPQAVLQVPAQPAAPLPATSLAPNPAAPRGMAQPAVQESAVPAVIPMPKSLFLSPQDQLNIKAALGDYENFLQRQKEQREQVKNEPEKAKEKTKQEEKYFTYPQFFLASLVYHTPNDWFVHINGKNFTPEMSPDQSDLAVVAIDNDRVVFRWKPADMNRVLEVWNQRPDSMRSIKDENGTIKVDFDSGSLDKVPNLPVMVDKERKLVTFSLHSNQTFSSFSMRVLEGKVLPVTVQNAPTAKPSKGASKVTLVPDTSPVDDSNSGLNGLMKAMDKKHVRGHNP